MFGILRQTYLLIRDVKMLTDLLTWGQNNGSTAHVFKWMGVHDGIHEFCPGFCPCETFNFDLEDEELSA